MDKSGSRTFLQWGSKSSILLCRLGDIVDELAPQTAVVVASDSMLAMFVSSLWPVRSKSLFEWGRQIYR